MAQTFRSATVVFYVDGRRSCAPHHWVAPGGEGGAWVRPRRLDVWKALFHRDVHVRVRVNQDILQSDILSHSTTGHPRFWSAILIP
jgi:hypothetical protein